MPQSITNFDLHVIILEGFEGHVEWYHERLVIPNELAGDI
jgi:hypothetical protein